MQNAFEYADAINAGGNGPAGQANGADEIRQGHRRTSSVENPHRPYLGLATFRMCVLADELLESFFTEFSTSWKLERQAEPAPKSTGAQGFLGGLVKAVFTDENKSRFYSFADEVGRRLDIQTVEQMPSIGKLDAAAAMAPVKDRETLLRSPAAVANAQTSPRLLASQDPLSHAAMREPAYPQAVAVRTVEEAGTLRATRPPQPVQAATGYFIEERPQFAIDSVGDEDDEDLSRDESSASGTATPGQGHADLMDEVDQFLAASGGHGDEESGVTEADKDLAKRGSSLAASVGRAGSLLRLQSCTRSTCRARNS